MEDFFQIGVVTTAHGVKGELKVYPTTDDPVRFKKLKNVIIDNGKTRKEHKVESVKFFKQFVILKAEGINTMDDALLYRNAQLIVARKDAVKCSKDEYFIADLIGIGVYNENDEPVGVLKDVFQTGANDVYEIEMPDGKTFLLPAIKECVLDVNLDEQKMKIHIMDGLI